MHESQTESDPALSLPRSSRADDGPYRGLDGPGGVSALLDADGHVLESGTEYAAMVGSSPPHPGQAWVDTLPEQLRPAAMSMLAEVRLAESSDRILPLLAEQLRWLRIRLRPVTGAQAERLLLVEFDDLSSPDERSLLAQLIRDPLTGLYNRRAFLELAALPPAVTARFTGVLAIDLRRFRRINDVWGRAVGDACLIETARWLRSICHPLDLLIRLADAEFLVLLTQLSTAPVALASEPQRTVLVGERSLQLSLQAGLATGQVLRETAERAEVALAEVKRDAWRSVVPWTQAIAAASARTARDEEAVQQAVQAGAEEVYFQPIVNVVTGRVAAVEGLVRLGGAAADVPTDKIIEASHRLGLTPTLADRVYDQAFAGGLRLRRVFPHCLLGINVSREFLSTGLAIDIVLAAAGRRGVDPSGISLELTEEVAAGLSPELLLSELRRGADAGLQIAIDDFGKGETSLSLLRKLPLTTIKLDRSLVPTEARDERGWDFVEGVVSLLSKISGRLIAEGIETPEQSFRLRQLGVYLQQGYLFGAPQPVEHWLAGGLQLPG